MAEESTIQIASVPLPLLLTEVPQSQEQLNVLQANMKAMATVVAEMKEIPQLPSEKPKDISPLQRVEMPPDGGVLTYMEGYEYPYKGFPYYEFVDRIDLLKKITRATLSGIYHELKKRNKLWFLTLLPSLWILKVAIRTGIYVIHRIVERFRLKKEKYCQAVREIHRVLSIDNPEEKIKDRDLRLQIRDCLCMILEFDNAYRYRTQDLMEELDKTDAKKNLAKEICRLLDIMSSREKTQEIKDTWTLFKMFVTYYLHFDKRMKTIIGNMLAEIDIEKVKLDLGDKQFCAKRIDYIFGFMLNK